MNQEFLPLCDILFNIISLVSYFCDVVFDIISIYTMYEQQRYVWFSVALVCVLTSLVASQVMSVTWYLRRYRKDRSIATDSHRSCEIGLALVTHVLQCGIMWRYFALFIPVDLRHVKQEIRDLCLLRLTHAFFQAAPMLLIQLFIIWNTTLLEQVTQLNVVSTALSLFSVCWALASFNKHLRPHNLHKLVLTWLGVIYQFFWRLGTVSSRVAALTLYATRYHFWVFLVISLHWATTFLWLVSQKKLFLGEKLSWRKRCIFSLLLSYVYVFCYINIKETNVRVSMLVYYVVMFLENTLLASVWLSLEVGSPWFKCFGAVMVWGGFAGGIIFMLLYYRYFHIRKLQSTKERQCSLPQATGCSHCHLGICSLHQNMNGHHLEVAVGNHVMDHSSILNNFSLKECQLHRLSLGDQSNGLAYIPGVFNCRLNPALKRKKKKPTTFIPIPAIQPLASPGVNGCKAIPGVISAGIKADVPFWKRHASIATKTTALQSEAEVLASRISIQQKLQKKKQQQLQELRVIQQEIEQGKLQRPAYLPDMNEQGTLHQPIPQSKKQPWVPPGVDVAPAFLPELLLSPQHLDSARVYFDCGNDKWRFAPSNGRPGKNKPTSSVECNGQCPVVVKEAGINGIENCAGNQLYKSYRLPVPSDLDSQISLPRSYTLPREFRYHRKPKLSKPVNAEYFVTSNNSNDGDVDSGEDCGGGGSGGGVGDNECEKAHHNGFHMTGAMLRTRPICPGSYIVTPCNLHETKL